MPASLSFEPNRGQTDPQVRYVARHGGTKIFITDHGAVFESSRIPNFAEMRNALGAIDAKKVKIVNQAIQMSIQGGGKPTALTAMEPQKSRSSYFIGNDPSKWVENLPHYGRVVAKAVYPGVDIAYYGHEGKLEYDLVVAPYADPSQIQMAFSGQKSMRLASNGDLILSTETGDFIQRQPKVYQDTKNGRIEVSSNYIVNGKTVGFQLASYDKSKQLVIDPTLVSSTYLGGTSSDSISSMAHTQ